METFFNILQKFWSWSGAMTRHGAILLARILFVTIVLGAAGMWGASKLYAKYGRPIQDAITTFDKAATQIERTARDVVEIKQEQERQGRRLNNIDHDFNYYLQNADKKDLRDIREILDEVHKRTMLIDTVRPVTNEVKKNSPNLEEPSGSSLTAQSQ